MVVHKGLKSLTIAQFYRPGYVGTSENKLQIIYLSITNLEGSYWATGYSVLRLIPRDTASIFHIQILLARGKSTAGFALCIS
jgi:hypothetical protein